MSELTGNDTEFTGESGKAWLFPVDSKLNTEASIRSWLLHAPYAHPMWTDHFLYVVHLRPVAGMPPAKPEFEGATHELGVMALNPEDQPWSIETLTEALTRMKQDGARPPYLRPHDVGEHFIATDQEASLIADYCARSVTSGRLVPDSDYASQWMPAIEATLAHLRGEHA